MRISFVIIAAALVVLVAVGGGSFYYFYWASGSAQASNAPPPKPYFVSLKSMVVNLKAPDKGNPMMSSDHTYLQVGFQFETSDFKAVSVFKEIRPAIRGNVLDLLLQQPPKVVDDQSLRQKMKAAVLNTVNHTIGARVSGSGKSPAFDHVYITRFVTQTG